MGREFPPPAVCLGRRELVRAVGIFSGGLDSMLAVETLRRQGIEVLAVTFETPFFSAERGKRSAQVLGVDHRVVEITGPYLEMLRNPRFGYGKNMNPCMDCHALMFKIAGQILDELGYDFLFSGEVLNQRPFSQNRKALQLVAEASGRPHQILRPLSAQRLPISGPEKEGLVDRKMLLGLQGRSRKAQMAIAAQWGIREYPTPAGGCLLTDVTYSRRLKDLFENDANWLIRDLQLLKLGRHLRLSKDHKAIVGRNHDENEAIKDLLLPGDVILRARDYPSPLVLVPAGAPEVFINTAGRICLRYSDAPRSRPSRVAVMKGNTERIIELTPLHPQETEELLI